MAKKTTEVAPRMDEQLPDFMRADGQDAGIDNLRDFIIPPRLKTVQKQSDTLLEAGFNPGDLVVMPSRLLFAQMSLDRKTGEPFHFVPLFFFAEWCTWNPFELKGTMPAIRERTFDAESPLAKKARDPSLRQFVCPEVPEKEGKKLYCRHVEHLNFMVLMADAGSEFSDVPLVLSFARGEYMTGSAFLSLLSMRRAKCYGCVFEGRAAFRPDKGKGSWYGVDVTNPTDGTPPFVRDQATYEAYKALNAGLAEAHAQRSIIVDYEDLDDAQNSDIDKGTSQF